MGVIKPLSSITASLEDSRSVRDRIIPTGFPTIDSKYYGLVPGELWVVGAYTGSGKSFLCLQLALNVLQRGKRVAYFSLEMPSEAVLARLWANLALLHPSQLEFGDMDLLQVERKEKAKIEIAKFEDSLFIIDWAYTMLQIKNVLSDLSHMGKSPQVVVIDFIQNLQSQHDEYRKLSDAIVEVQRLAKEQGFTAIVASQTSNEGQQLGAENEVIAYKGTGAIAAAADFGIWLKKPTSYEGDNTEIPIELSFRKVRRGPNKRLNVILRFPGGRIEEATV